MYTFQKVWRMISFELLDQGILYFGRFWVDPSHDSTNLLYVATTTGKTNELSYDNSYSRNIWFFIFLQNCKNLPSARQGPRDRNSWKMWKIIFLFNHCQIQQPQLCLYQFPPTGHQMVKSKNAFELPFCGCFEIIWWFVWIRLNMLYWSWLVFVLSFNWGSEAFICQQFLFVQLVDLKKVRTENLKFRTDIQDWVMDDLSVTQLMINLSSILLKKSSNLQIKAPPINAGLYMVFKHSISFVTNLIVNFSCDWCRIMPDIFSKLLLKLLLTAI